MQIQIIRQIIGKDGSEMGVMKAGGRPMAMLDATPYTREIIINVESRKVIFELFGLLSVFMHSIVELMIMCM